MKSENRAGKMLFKYNEEDKIHLSRKGTNDSSLWWVVERIWKRT